MATLSVTPGKDELVRRAELIAQAEELAAIATEHAALARDATPQDLLSLSFEASALEQTALAYAGAYARWAEIAGNEDRLLARSLEAVTSTLRVLADQAHITASEAEDYAESVRDTADG